MKHDRRGRADAGRRARGQNLVEVLLVVGQARQDRCDEHRRSRCPRPRSGQRISSRFRPGGVPGSTTRRTLSSSVPTLIIDRQPGALASRRCGSTSRSRRISVDFVRIESALAASASASDDCPRQPVAALALLVRVGRGSHGYRLARPPRRRELATEHVGDVRLHDDLRREVLADPEIEVGVIGAGEAVVAAVRAAAVRVHRPAKRHARSRRHPVQRGLAGVLEVRDREPRRPV